MAPPSPSTPPVVAIPHLEDLRRSLLDWFAGHARDLPWRRTYDPYHVWLSEVMLQQTQMDRASAYFQRFLTACPNVYALAELEEERLLALWEGLGYYNRARNLQRAARQVVAAGGRLPESVEGLRNLPGVGPYTAAAIASIAFGQDVALVDANVERVLARLFDLDEPIKSPALQRRLHHLADHLLPPGQAREFNQALMELGALVCKPRAPQCSACPLTTHCEARRLGIVLERPVPGKPRQFTDLEVASVVIVHDGRVFVQKRPESGVWAGLWEFPGGRIESGETPAQAAVREIAEETAFHVADLTPLSVIRHGYTTYRIRLHCFACRLAHPLDGLPQLTAAQDHRWASLAEVAALAFPAGHRKLLDALPQDLRFHALLANSRQ